MGFASTWLRQVSPLLHKTTLTTAYLPSPFTSIFIPIPSKFPISYPFLSYPFPSFRRLDTFPLHFLIFPQIKNNFL